MQVTRFEDTAVRVYKTVPFRPPPSWRGDINYSARTKLANFDALPTQDGSCTPAAGLEPQARSDAAAGGGGSPDRAAPRAQTAACC